MQTESIYVMSIAGFDPSGGAGLLADIKTFEQFRLHGLSISTADTLQTENEFHSLEWKEQKTVLKNLDVLLNAYSVKAIKIGIVPSFNYLADLVIYIRKKSKTIKIIVDPVIRSSTGFDFHTEIEKSELKKVLENIDLITPNVEEAMKMTRATTAKEGALTLARYCSVLLKGGHSDLARGTDLLYTKGACVELRPSSIDLPPKHGSGCVLSAAITASLAKGNDLTTACTEAKQYVEQFLKSDPSLLGFHHAN